VVKKRSVRVAVATANAEGRLFTYTYLVSLGRREFVINKIATLEEFDFFVTGISGLWYMEELW
jgi:hypothetical protein